MAEESEFNFRDEFPKRSMVGRIYRVDPLSDGTRGRISIELDALDDQYLLSGDDLRGFFLSENVKPFGLIRVMSTMSRFAKVMGREPAEGDWYRFQLLPKREFSSGAPLPKLTAWHAQLTDRGYTERSRGYVVGAEFLQGDGERPRRTLSATVPSIISQAQDAIAGSQIPNVKYNKKHAVEKLLSSFDRVESIVVHDVGQASFITIYDTDDNAIAHYDAGWPVSFNGETCPKDTPICSRAPVILSHWDWDHLSGYYRFGVLQKVTWIAPVQYLGFGAGRIAARLFEKGLLLSYDGPVLQVGSFTLGVCSGPKKEKNQTGLALRVALPGIPAQGNVVRAILLTGDADYDHTPPALRAPPIHGLLVAHHGASLKGAVPMAASKSSIAIVSVGRGNRYKHPKPSTLNAHKSKNWLIRMTMTWATRSRGARWFL